MLWFKNLIKISKKISNQSPLVSPSLTQFLQFTKQYSTNSHHVVGLEPTKNDQKARIVVLGSGWAGCRLMKDIDTNIYDVVCVSPRNHMVFTPLLASTCVGTLEFRSVAEPIGRIQPAVSKEPTSYFFLAKCNGIDFDNHMVCLVCYFYYCCFSLFIIVVFRPVCIRLVSPTQRYRITLSTCALIVFHPLHLFIRSMPLIQ